ncbi:MAG: hypothetical protein GXO89_14465 [Chlorobi bacterium]|nr:hypothetical protein [Chlorobiota bacterium]
MKKTILSLFVVLALQTLNAQSFQDKFFMSAGWSLLYYTTPSNLYPVLKQVGSDPVKYVPNGYNNEHHFNGYGVGYIIGFRYNLVELDDEMSISAEVPVTLGISFATEVLNSDISVGPSSGFGNVNIPLVFQFNYGNGATYNSSGDMGFVAGFGLEFNFNPIIAINDYSEGEILDVGNFSIEPEYYKYEKIKKSFFQPVVQLGLRYWNKNNKLKEVSLKYGFGGSTEWTTGAGNSIESHSPMNLQLTFTSILNY